MTPPIVVHSCFNTSLSSQGVGSVYELTTLIFVRHGVTHENLNYTLIGRTDPPLHRYGNMQADAVADALCAVRLDAVVSSPLDRCLSTAQRIAQRHGIRNTSTVDALSEIDLGIVDGLSSFVAYEKYQVIMDRALDPTLPDYRFPQGESRVEALVRFQTAVDRLIEQHPHGNVCVVTHGGPLGLWLAHLHQDCLGRFREWQPSHASITRVSCDNESYHIVSRDETDHLPKELQNLIRQARECMP